MEDGATGAKLGKITHQILAPVAAANNGDIPTHCLFPQPDQVAPHESFSGPAGIENEF